MVHRSGESYLQFAKRGMKISRCRKICIILTARGKKPTAKIDAFKIGDEIEISVSVKDLYGNNEAWQNDVLNAVGGHMVFAKDGKYNSIGDTTSYPTTILAETNSGNILFIQNDGRQKEYSIGFRFSDYTKLAKEFDLKNAFLLDGGRFFDANCFGGKWLQTNQPAFR